MKNRERESCVQKIMNSETEFVYLDVQDDSGLSIRRFKCLMKAAKMSTFLTDMLEHTTTEVHDGITGQVLPLPRKHCSPYAIEQIIKWSEYHCDDPLITQPTNNRSFDEDDNDNSDNSGEISCYWDRNFMHNIASPNTALTAESRSNLYDLLIASHFLAIDRLTDLGSKFLCKLIAGKSCEEVRNLLNIANDFQPDEERILHDQIAWSERAKRT